jgi:hypothetical protein
MNYHGYSGVLIRTTGPILQICASARMDVPAQRSSALMLFNLPYDFGKKMGEKSWAA